MKTNRVVNTLEMLLFLQEGFAQGGKQWRIVVHDYLHSILCVT